MTQEPEEPFGAEPPRPRVAFDYIKSTNFRVVRADGAIGGITPNGFIHFALYTERAPIPRRLVHEVKENGALGGPIPGEEVVRDAVVREMDTDVYVTIETAMSLHKWLGEKIEEWAKTRSSAGGKK